MKRTRRVKNNKKHSRGGRRRCTRARRNIRRQKAGAKYTLLPWIDKNKLKLQSLVYNENPAVIDILETYEDIDNYTYKNIDPIYFNSKLSTQPWAVDFLLEHPKLINWSYFSENPSTTAVNYLIKNPKNIDWPSFCINPNPLAIEYLKEHQDKIEWDILSKNPSAIQLLKENIDKIGWLELSLNKNPEALEILKNNRENIDWKYICNNSTPAFVEFLNRPENVQNITSYNYLNNSSSAEAIDYLKSNPDKITYMLSYNSNPNAIKLLREHPDKIHWVSLSVNSNPEAIKLLKENISQIEWIFLCKNENPEAMELLKNNLNKINDNPLALNYLSKNPAAIEILEENQDKIVWKEFSKNPGIFYDYYYKKMKELKKKLHEEYEELVYHPDVRLDPDNPLYVGKVDPDNFMAKIKTIK